MGFSERKDKRNGRIYCDYVSYCRERKREKEKSPIRSVSKEKRALERSSSVPTVWGWGGAKVVFLLAREKGGGERRAQTKGGEVKARESKEKRKSSMLQHKRRQ